MLKNLVSIMIIFLGLSSFFYEDLGYFQLWGNVLSILSGTGYVTDDFGLWGEFPLIFFM